MMGSYGDVVDDVDDAFEDEYPQRNTASGVKLVTTTNDCGADETNQLQLNNL